MINKKFWKVYLIIITAPFCLTPVSYSASEKHGVLHVASNFLIDNPPPKSVGISKENEELLYSMSRAISELLPDQPNFKLKFTRSNYFSAKPNCVSPENIGTILIGPHKFHKLKDQPKIVFELLFAHEAAHILHFLYSRRLTQQLCNGEKLKIKDIELLADFIAGFIIERTKGVSSKELQRATMIAISNHSDYQFSNKQNHHGTATERINAVNYGRAVASLDKELNIKKFISNLSTLKNNLGGIPAHQFINKPGTIEYIYKELFNEMYQ